jgi:hypothetical protein
MERQRRSRRSRVLLVGILLALLAVSAGGYYWYEHVSVRYDRITNAKRV